MILLIEVKIEGRPPTQTELEALGYDEAVQWFKDMIILNPHRMLAKAEFTLQSED